MTTNHTCRCGRAVHDGTVLCARCVHTLDVALANVSAHHADLETLRTKRTRYGNLGATKGSTGKTMPIGVDLRFVAPSNAALRDDKAGQVPGREGQGSELVHDVRNTLSTWVRVCLDEWPSLRCPADTVTSMTRFLQSYLTAMAGQAWADELLTDALRLERALARLVDRPAERWYAGKCSVERRTVIEDGTVEVTLCERELYATQEDGKLRCSSCGTVHDVAGRREFLLHEASGYHVTASEAASALLAWTDYDGSEKKLVDLIYTWRDRDRLAVADVTSLQGKDRHLYRLGDIQDLLVQHAQRKQAQRIRTDRSA